MPWSAVVTGLTTTESIAPPNPGSGLRAIDLRLSYQHQVVVETASVTLIPGEVFALVGPNGSGKSTLLRALARLHRPDGGDLEVDEISALGMPSRSFARLVTLLAQSRPTPTGVSVHDVVGYGRHPHRARWGGGDPEGERAVGNAMELTGVTHMAARSADQLSGGELQRVWLATCLAQETQVLLLDEPTSHLDLRYQVEILDLVRDLADKHGVAIGIVLHDLNQAAAIADRMALVDHGQIRVTGTPETVLTAEHLSEVYGIDVAVAPDPVSGALTVRPVGRHNIY